MAIWQQVRRGGFKEASVFALVLVMVVMLVVPLPWQLLDILISANLSIALLVLLVAMSTGRPIDFSVFPSLLLLTTLFRLALNVSSARLILLHGFAGDVIESFGRFVVGGNPLVGFIMYLILVVIQFVVITRGAERVAEVAARFTLDAMPGKQMAIDADLNSGLINEEMARTRRLDIEREADFYGAMDGGSKFVKGDAIAGLVITAVNIIGGLITGIWEKHMTLTEALHRYTLLTVGDGLVSQLPALLLSTATGILVTRAAAVDGLGVAVISQLFVQPQLLGVTGLVLLVFSLIPGLPFVPFMFLAILFFVAAYLLYRRQALRDQEENQEAPSKIGSEPENLSTLLQVDTLEVGLGYALLGLADPAQGGDLLERIGLLRRQVATELGLLLNPIRVRDNLRIQPESYEIKLKGTRVALADVKATELLAMTTQRTRQPLDGMPAKDPVFGVDAYWIRPQERLRAEGRGYTVIDTPSILMTHLKEMVHQHAAELLGRQDVAQLVDMVKGTKPALVDDVMKELTLGDLQRVLQALLREQVSIRDMGTILEALSDAIRQSKELDTWVDHVRSQLFRQIMNQYNLDAQEPVPVLSFSQSLDARFRDATRWGDISLDRLADEVAAGLRPILEEGKAPILVVAKEIRSLTKRALGQALPKLVVLSVEEVAQASNLEVVGVIEG